jgi:hypothetical protein
MIASGLQVKAARSLLGWSQADLARAAEINVNAVRYWERQHGQRLHPISARGFAPTRMASALRRAGVVLQHDPIGCVVDPARYPDDLKPPVFQRWEKHWKPNSKRAQRECRTEFRLLVKAVKEPRL